MRAILCVVASAVCLVASGCGSSDTYSADDVTQAFGGQRLELSPLANDELGSRQAGLDASGAKLFQPRRLEDYYVVIVLPDDVAAKAWRAYVAAGADANTFNARRANVLVIADDGVRAETRTRIVAALAALPDRGDKVVTLRA
jgi:hypothetical protein